MGRWRSPALPTTADSVEPGTLFFCVPGQRSDGHDFGHLAVEAGAAALVVERLLDLPVTQARVADARAAMAAGGGSLLGRPHGAAARRGRHRHQREDHDGLPDPPRPRGTRRRRRGFSGTVKRVVGGVEEEVERTTPEAIDLQQTLSPHARGGAMRRARWRSPRTPWRWSAPPASTSRSPCSPTSPRITSTSTRDMEEYFGAKRSLFVTSATARRGGQPRRSLRRTARRRAGEGR